MKRVLTLVVVVIICAAIVACQPGAAGLSDQDKAAIRNVVDKVQKMAVAPGVDWGAYVTLYYAPGAKVLAPNMPALEGREAIKTAFASMGVIQEEKWDIVSFEGRSDLAFVHGTYTMTSTPPGSHAPVRDKGKYVEIWQKQADGVWKVTQDIWNSDLPAPGIIVPTGTMAADASPEIRKLADIVGRWDMNGTFQPDPKVAAGPVALTLTCNWFGGLQLFCRYSGIMAGAMEEVDVYGFDPKTKMFTFFYAVDSGRSVLGKLAIQPGTWIHTYDTLIGGKPAHARFTFSNMSPAGGDWGIEASIAGGPWAAVAGGTYVKAK
jgi:ketosteroid isomerase-like protein